MSNGNVLLVVKNVLFTVVVPGTVAGYLPFAIVGGTSAASTSWLVTGSLLYFAGAAIYLSCVWDFASFGRATPAPIDAPKKLVIRGLYRTVRNPMYVGVLMVILGWVVCFQSLELLGYGLSVAVAFHLFVCLYEEPHLKKSFPQNYEQYCSRVNRWLPRSFDLG